MSAIIIYYVGKICNENGIIYLKLILKHQLKLANEINKILLIGYYLLNIGYALITIVFWIKIQNLTNLFETVCQKLGTIILTIALLHYGNIFIVNLISKNIK